MICVSRREGAYSHNRRLERCENTSKITKWYSILEYTVHLGFLFWTGRACVPDDAEISREVAEWDGALLPLLARSRGRDETSVSRNKETQPNNNPKERYKTVVQRGVAEGRREEGGEKMAGSPEQSGEIPF